MLKRRLLNEVFVPLFASYSYLNSLFVFPQDSFGRRGILCLICAISTIPVYGLLTFGYRIHPLIPLIWLGFNYSMASVSENVLHQLDRPEQYTEQWDVFLSSKINEPIARFFTKP